MLLTIFCVVALAGLSAGFNIKNDLDRKITVYHGGYDGFWERLNQKAFSSNFFEILEKGKNAVCPHDKKGCHDKGKKQAGEEIHFHWKWCCSPDEDKPGFEGPNTALYRFTYIDESNKQAGVKLLVYKEGREEQSHFLHEKKFEPANPKYSEDGHKL